jgi:O-acetylserine/cysteine efflux transporter
MGFVPAYRDNASASGSLRLVAPNATGSYRVASEPEPIYSASVHTPSSLIRPATPTSTVLLMAALLVLDSFHFVFARLLLPYVDPRASALYVMIISTVEVGAFGLATGRLHWASARRHAWFFVAIGLLVGVNMSIHYEAMAFIDPGTASLLSQTAVLFGLGLGVFWLHDHLTLLQGGGALLALAGIFVISFQPGDYLRLGSLLIIISTLAYALHAALTKRYGGGIDLVDFFFFRLLFTSIALIAIVALRGGLVWPTPKAWALIVLVGTVDVVLSRALYYLALRRLSMSIHTIALTLSPIAATAWAFVIFGALPGLQQAFGGAAIVAGVFIVSLGRSRSR